MFENLNWIAILLAAASTLAVGFVWYHPKVFGTIWQQSINLSDDDLKSGNMPMIFGVSFLMAVVAAIYLFHNIHGSFTHGAFHAGRIGLMMVAPVIINNALFERKGWTPILINVGYWVVTTALMGGIMVLFQSGE